MKLTHTDTLACKQLRTGACTCSCIHANADAGSHKHPLTVSFQRLSAGQCQSQFCSDQPVWCALLLSASGEIEERKWGREIERKAYRDVSDNRPEGYLRYAWISPWQTHGRETGWSMVGSLFLHVCWVLFCNGVDSKYGRHVKNKKKGLIKIG